MTSNGREPLRIVLLDHSYGSNAPGERYVRELAGALAESGHQPLILSSHAAPPRRSVEGGLQVLRTRRPLDAVLRWRGFTRPLTQAPFGVAAMLAGRFDVAHAFSTQDALTARAWSRVAGRPTVFTCTEILGRERLADQRLRLWLLQRAVQDTDALLASTEESRTALLRWLAIDAPVVDSRDASGHERLYRQLLTSRG